MLTLYSSLSVGIILPAFISAYKWPNPVIDELDHQLFNQRGYNAINTIAQRGVADCSLFFEDGRRGRQNAAEVRLPVNWSTQFLTCPLVD
jgi:hypothetical protein